MNYRILLFSLLVGFPTLLQGQYEDKYESNRAPDWAKEMYKSDADVGTVVSMYEAYYKQNIFIKNEHNQYYKRWLRKLAREVNQEKKKKR